MLSWRHIKIGLKEYYTAPMDACFKQFRSGLIYFAVGLGTILAANSNMEASAQQEWVMLGGLILGGTGFFMSMMAQARFLISRIIRFWSK